MVKVEAAVGITPGATRRLGALAVWVAEDAERLWQRLRLSNAEHGVSRAQTDSSGTKAKAVGGSTLKPEKLACRAELPQLSGPGRRGMARTYLVVIDDSPEARVALRFAARRAAKTGGEVDVLAVVEPQDFVQWGGVQAAIEEEQRLRIEGIVAASVGEIMMMPNVVCSCVCL